MLTYYIVLALWTIVYLLSPNLSVRCSGSILEYECNPLGKVRYYTIFVSTTLALLIGLKSGSVGTDSLAYMSDYIYSSSVPVHDSLSDLFMGEFGFQYLCYFLNHVIGLPWQFFLLLYGAFVSYVFGKFVYRYSNNVYISFLIHLTFGLFAMSMSGIRQTLAVSFALLAYIQLVDKRFFKFFILILIASSIHFTAICCLIFPLVTRMRYRKKSQLLIGLLLPIFVRFLGKFFFQIAPYLPLKYENSGYFDELNLQISAVVEVVMFVLLIVCYVGLLLNSKKISTKDLHMFTMVGCYVSAIELSHFVYMSSRLGFYFVPFMTILVPNIIGKFSANEGVRAALNVACFVLFLMAFAISMPGSSYGISNYSFYWEL